MKRNKNTPSTPDFHWMRNRFDNGSWAWSDSKKTLLNDPWDTVLGVIQASILSAHVRPSRTSNDGESAKDGFSFPLIFMLNVTIFGSSIML